ncbi:MAG: thiamine pyrophosphate-binding protein [Candidatus Zipacnadales bacterium]
MDVAAIAAQLSQVGVTHVVWVPDSELGPLEFYLAPSICVVRACREGEALTIAAGLMLGGARPVVVCQCTGFFEAGGAFRNVVKDLHLPLFLLIGHRGRTALQTGRSHDSAAVYLEPVLAAWELGYEVLEPGADPSVISNAYRHAQETHAAFAIVVAE